MKFQVAKISEEKANKIRGLEYDSGYFFNPIKIEDGYIVTIAEAEFLDLSDFVLYELEIKSIQ
jgi:hypothetical protein